MLKKIFVWCWTVPHRAQILWLNFIKYYSLWLHVSSQLSLLDGYFITQKYNELNHCDRTQINKNSDKNIKQWLFSRLSYLDRLCLCSSIARLKQYMWKVLKDQSTWIFSYRRILAIRICIIYKSGYICHLFYIITS